MRKIRVVCPLIDFQIQNFLFSKGEKSQKEILAILKERNKQIMEGIELVEGVKIRPFNKQDIEAISSSFFVPSMSLEKHITTRTFMLEKILRMDKEQISKTEKLMRNIVLALRLLKEGNMYGDDVFDFDLEKGHLLSWSREGHPPIAELTGRGYALDFEDIPKLKEIITKVQRVNFEERKSLALACKRFERVYQEYHFEDRLIDYMIAFEALFLKGERRASSRGKIIAIACSTLLGSNEKEREEIKKTLNVAYAMRNCIVHGGEFRKDIDPFEIIEEISSYLRNSIVRFLD